MKDNIAKQLPVAARRAYYEMVLSAFGTALVICLYLMLSDEPSAVFMAAIGITGLMATAATAMHCIRITLADRHKNNEGPTKSLERTTGSGEAQG